MKTLMKKPLLVLILSATNLFFLPSIVGVSTPAIAATVNLPDFADLVERTGPAVVNIRTTQKVQVNQAQGDNAMPDMQEFFKRYFGIPLPAPQQPENNNGQQRRKKSLPLQEEEVPRGVGSGFILSADGYVLTNAHVVDGADDVYVKLTDKREFKAKIIGSDKRSDVALLKIDGEKLPTLTMGSSEKTRVGEWVIAIGSPFDLDNTVTAGIVSAKARETGEYLPLIQTDVAVNPGNSGGPLINMRGEVIGVNSQIYSRSGGYMGISFAIPIEEAIRVSEQIKTTGKVVRGRLGVQIGEVSKEIAESLGLSKTRGALVQKVEADGPAEKAGIESGDIILKFNGVVIDRVNDLPRLVGNTKPGVHTTIQLWRKGALRDVKVVVTEQEGDVDAKKDKNVKPESASINMLGLTVTNLSEAQKREFKLSGGVVVTAVEGTAARARLRPGDLILQLNTAGNNVDVVDVKQFNTLVEKLDKQKNVVLLVRRGDTSQYVALRPAAQ